MSEISDEKYVSCTTFRRTGGRVSTPVWITDLHDGTIGFTTDGDSGKVKRLARDPRVELRPCNGRGKVADDAEPRTGTARVVPGDDADRIRAAIVDKYGLTARMIGLVATITRRDTNRCGIVITLDD